MLVLSAFLLTQSGATVAGSQRTTLLGFCYNKYNVGLVDDYVLRRVKILTELVLRHATHKHIHYIFVSIDHVLYGIILALPISSFAFSKCHPYMQWSKLQFMNHRNRSPQNYPKRTTKRKKWATTWSSNYVNGPMGQQKGNTLHIS